MFTRFNVTAHLCRVLFLVILTTIVFYTFADRHESETPRSHPLITLCRPPRPSVFVILANTDQNTPFLLPTFYLVGLQIGADFYLSDQLDPDTWSTSETQSAIVFCLSACSSLIARLHQRAKNVVIIAAARDPVQLFRKRFSDTNVQAFDRAGGDLVRYAAEPERYYRASDSDAPFSRNFLSASFEIDPNGDYSAFVDALQMLDTMGAFVIICEYMLESIVLLKHTLGLECIDWDGLLYIYQDGDYEQSANTPLNNQIKNWNELDWELYGHFNTSLSRRISQFGATRLVEEIAATELRLEDTSAACGTLAHRMEYCAGVSLCFDLCYGKVTDRDVINSLRNYFN